MQEQTKINLYREFCEKASLPVFVQAWYLDIVCKGGKWDFVFVEEEGEVVAVHPYFLKRKFGFSYITMPNGVKYMGPFLRADRNTLADQHRIYTKLLEQLPVVHSFWQNCDPNIDNWLPYHWKDFNQSTRYTYRLNIEDPEDLYRGLSEKTRYKLRKAGKILNITDQYSSLQFHQVHQMSFDRQGIQPPFDLNGFMELDELLEKRNSRKMFFAADKDENIHAVLYIIIDSEIAYMHFLGSNPNFTKSEAVNFLYWHVIQYLNEHHKSIRLIDFQGGMMRNIENIFRRFRAIQTPYFSITKEDSNLFKFIQRLKSKMSAL